MDEPIRKRTEDDEQDRPLDVLPFSPERIAYWAKLERDAQETLYPI